MQNFKAPRTIEKVSQVKRIIFCISYVLFYQKVLQRGRERFPYPRILLTKSCLIRLLAQTYYCFFQTRICYSNKILMFSCLIFEYIIHLILHLTFQITHIHIYIYKIYTVVVKVVLTIGFQLLCPLQYF